MKMKLSQSTKDYCEDWEGRYQRGLTKRASKDDNFKLDGRGDLVMIAPLTNHAKQRCKERNVSIKNALKASGEKTSKSVNAVVATVIPPGNREQNAYQTAPTERQLPDGHITQSISAPKSTVGYIIGKKGTNVERLREQFNVEVDIQQNKTDTKRSDIYVHGLSDDVQKALEDIQAVVDDVATREQKQKDREAPDPRTLRDDQSMVSITVAERFIGYVLGKGKKNVNSVTSKCNVKYKIKTIKGGMEIVVWGLKSDVRIASDIVYQLVDKARVVVDSSVKDKKGPSKTKKNIKKEIREKYKAIGKNVKSAKKSKIKKGSK